MALYHPTPSTLIVARNGLEQVLGAVHYRTQRDRNRSFSPPSAPRIIAASKPAPAITLNRSPLKRPTSVSGARRGAIATRPRCPSGPEVRREQFACPLEDREVGSSRRARRCSAAPSCHHLGEDGSWQPSSSAREPAAEPYGLRHSHQSGSSIPSPSSTRRSLKGHRQRSCRSVRSPQPSFAGSAAAPAVRHANTTISAATSSSPPATSSGWCMPRYIKTWRRTSPSRPQPRQNTNATFVNWTEQRRGLPYTATDAAV